MGIKTKDPELERMIERTDTNYIERSVVEQLDRANKPIMEQLAKEFPEILKYPVTKPLEIVQNITSDSDPNKTKSRTR